MMGSMDVYLGISAIISAACGVKAAWKAGTDSKPRCANATKAGGDSGEPPATPCSTDTLISAAPSFRPTMGMVGANVICPIKSGTVFSRIENIHTDHIFRLAGDRPRSGNGL